MSNSYTATNTKFITEDFLLKSKAAQYLYHEHAANLPIIDYHNHLSPAEIATDKQFDNITQIWLYGDHYKWRAMRANGVAEHYISGAAKDEEKFDKWAHTVPYTMRNPLYHWTHLELSRYFNIDTLLSPKSASEVYASSREMLLSKAYSTQNLLRKMKVESLCTTDDPTDTLEAHHALKNSEFEIKVLPTFRPDKFILIQHPNYQQYLSKLSEITQIEINNFTHLLEALKQRVEYFHEMGCRLSDHGLSHLYSDDFTETQLNNILLKKLNNEAISPEESRQYQSGLLHHLAKMYHEKGWVMQLHLGALRNTNKRLLNSIGADAGCDSIGDYSQAEFLAAFLNRLDEEDQLSKTILYNLNPADNEVFATMTGNFNDGSIAGKVQWGSAWWFLDQKDGMEKQINTLSNMGLLSRFIGMLTDSRSFLSYPRHEYFRRILCNLIGEDVENGELPNDMNWLGEMVENICYRNAKNFFDF
ncbi:MAG: glucuronate isomerase [Bacteroidota bacterium]